MDNFLNYILVLQYFFHTISDFQLQQVKFLLIKVHYFVRIINWEMWSFVIYRKQPFKVIQKCIGQGLTFVFVTSTDLKKKFSKSKRKYYRVLATETCFKRLSSAYNALLCMPIDYTL